jgi:hypothetical protein
VTDDEEDKVVDFTMWRSKKGAQHPPADPVVAAAQKLTDLLGDTASTLGTVDALAALSLATRAMMIMLRQAVGEGNMHSLLSQGAEKAEKYNINTPTHYNGPTVFDDDEG